jgi:hypothetical protein
MAGAKSKQSGSVQLSIGSVLPGRTAKGKLSKRPRKAGGNVRVGVDAQGNIDASAERVIRSERARIEREDRTAGRTSQGSGRMSSRRKAATRRLAEMRLLRAARQDNVGYSNPRGATGKLAGTSSRNNQITLAEKTARGKNPVSPTYRETRRSAANALRAGNPIGPVKRRSTKKAAAKKIARKK